MPTTMDFAFLIKHSLQCYCINEINKPLPHYSKQLVGLSPLKGIMLVN